MALNPAATSTARLAMAVYAVACIDGITLQTLALELKIMAAEGVVILKYGQVQICLVDAVTLLPEQGSATVETRLTK